MLVKHKAELSGTDRAVETERYVTNRLLLAGDGVGITVTDVTIKGGVDAEYGFAGHVEVCYCLEGHATLQDLSTGQSHEILPGSLWATEVGERFRFHAHQATRLVSIFTPALTGHER